MNKFMKKNNLILMAVALFLPFISSCRGDKSSSPSVILIQNMVNQTSYGPQSKNTFFKNGLATRDPVVGTVAQGEADTNSKLHQGLESGTLDKNPVWVSEFPMPLTHDMLKRGQERYNIYCSPCHGYDAQNDGLVTKVSGGSIRPANLHDKDKIQMPVGKIYNAVTNGVNNWNMPGFQEQMSQDDRWAVVAYVRALQMSKLASPDDIPKDKQK